MRGKALVACFAIIVASSAVAQSAKPSGEEGPKSVSSEDKKFLDYAAEDNQAEIQLCILAEKSARAPAVKAFARLMVNDHVAIESRLASVLNGENVDAPTGIGKEGQETFSKLSKLSGEGFDREFIRAQIEDHSHDLQRFGQQQSSTTNQSIRQFASQTIPILDQHLKLAQAVQAAMAQGAAK